MGDVGFGHRSNTLECLCTYHSCIVTVCLHSKDDDWSKLGTYTDTGTIPSTLKSRCNGHRELCMQDCSRRACKCGVAHARTLLAPLGPRRCGSCKLHVEQPVKSTQHVARRSTRQDISVSGHCEPKFNQVEIAHAKIGAISPAFQPCPESSRRPRDTPIHSSRVILRRELYQSVRFHI